MEGQGLPAIPLHIHSMLSVTYFSLHNCRSQPTIYPGAGMSRKCLVHSCLRPATCHMPRMMLHINKFELHKQNIKSEFLKT